MSKLVLNVVTKWLTLLGFFLYAVSSFAINGRTTYQAKIIKPDGYPLESASVNFRFTVLDQSGSCALYIEDYAAINMTDTAGLISFPLGTGTRAFPTSGTAQTFQNTFDNSITSFACQTMGIYNPNPTDTRKIVMQFNDGGGWQTLPAMSINAVPYAMFATRSDNSRLLNNKADTAFVEYSTIPTCTASQALQYTGANFVCVAAGGSGGVTSGAITTALGYTPADPSTLSASYTTQADFSVVSGSLNAMVTSVLNLSTSVGAITSSQWSSSGTGLYYNTGNVGIGTSNPVAALEVNAPVSAGFMTQLKVTDGSTGGYFAVTEGASLSSRYLPMFEYSSASVSGYGGVLIGKISSAYDLHVVNGAAIVVDGRTASNTALTNANLFLVRNHTMPALVVQASGTVGIGTTTPVTKLDVSGGVRISMESADCNAGLAGTIRYNSGNLEYCNGTSWSALGVAGAGITSLNSSTSGSQTFATGITGTVFNISSNNGVHTFNVPLAASGSVTAGLLSNADYVTFTNKISATSAAVISALGYTPASATGLGALASLNFLDLGSALASGTLSAARLPAFSGDASSSLGSSVLTLTSVGAGVTSGSQYTKVTVDGKGRVISGAQLALGDVTTALGYTPANTTHYPGSSTATFTDVELNTKLGYVASTTSLFTQTQLLKGDSYGANMAEVTGQHVSSLILNTYDHAGHGNNGVFISKTPFGGTFKTSGTIMMAIKNNGTVGVGIVNPTAKMHLSAGAASMAPLKFTSGTLLSSPQSGTIEYDGAYFYLTDGTNNRRAILTDMGGNYAVNHLTSSGNITFTPNSSVVVSSTTNSTSSNTGAFIVKGGMGVGADLNVAGIISGSAIVKATGYRANQGAPDNADGSTNGYSFGLDGDTGLFSPGAGGANGVVAIFNNNAETMRVVPGAVGIGTINPAYTLHVQHPISGASTIGVEAFGSTAGMYFRRANGTATAPQAVSSGQALAEIAAVGHGTSGYIATSAAKILMSAENNWTDATAAASIRFHTRGVSSTGTSLERLRIAHNGNVGVGTETPQRKLHVSSASSSDGLLLDNGTSDSNNLIFHDSTQGVSGVTWNLDSANGAFRIFTEPITSVNPLIATNGNERLTIIPSGFVGIGTTAPADALHVVGAITAANASATAKLTLTPDFSGSGFLQSYSAPGVFRPLAIEGKSIVMNGNGSGTAFIGGDVGIGTTTPAAALHLVTQNTASPAVVIDTDSDVGDQAFKIRASGDGGAGLTDADTKFIVMGGGNVGVGTSAPITRLEVNGSLSSKGGDLILQRPLSGGNWARGVHYTPDGSVNTTLDGLAGLGIYGASTTAQRMYLTFGAAPWNSTAGIQITSAGNVGIGTSSPTSKLEVRGGNTFMEGRAYVYSNSGWGATTPSVTLALGDNDTGFNWVADGEFQVYANNQPRMHFDLSGNTGVGTTDPQYSLDVAGNFRVGGQAYTNTGASTFTVLSDVRYKDVHGSFERGLSDLLKIETIRFNYKVENPLGSDPSREYVGLSAQNLETAIPEAVEKQNRKGVEFLTVNTSPVIYAMINAIKEIYHKVVGNDREIASLKEKNEELEAKLKEFDELKAYICKKDPQAPNCK